MISIAHRFLARSVVLVALSSTLAYAQAPPVAEALSEFTSKEGKFSVSLPGKPQYEKVPVGDSGGEQHQFVVGLDQGAYLISYQDNPNLEGGAAEDLQAALEKGREVLQQTFKGELLESENVTLADATSDDVEHPGISFRVSMPEAGGEARCRFYMVGTRLYQVMALGVPAFTAADEATAMLDSFKLLP